MVPLQQGPAGVEEDGPGAGEAEEPEGEDLPEGVDLPYRSLGLGLRLIIWEMVSARVRYVVCEDLAYCVRLPCAALRYPASPSCAASASENVPWTMGEVQLLPPLSYIALLRS